MYFKMAIEEDEIEQVENLVGRKITEHGIEKSEILNSEFPYITFDDGRRIYLSKSQ